MREISQKTSIHLTGIPERMNNLEEGIISKTQYKKKNAQIWGTWKFYIEGVYLVPDTMKENRSILRNMFVKFWEATDKDNTLNVYRGKIKSFHTQRNTNDINQAFQQCLNLEESFRILLAAKVTIHKFSEIRRKPFSNMLGRPLRWPPAYAFSTNYYKICCIKTKEEYQERRKLDSENRDTQGLVCF